MAINKLVETYPSFYDSQGQPLENGSIYIGEQNKNPETNPIEIFKDNALTIPVAQPLSTLSGYVALNGTPTNIYFNDNYSITVKDKTGAIIYTSLSNNITERLEVDTIADLKAVTIPTSTVWVSGYHIKGDGAYDSNIFEWDSTSVESDNGGTIIKVDSIATGRYKLKYETLLSNFFGVSVSRTNSENTTHMNSAISYALNFGKQCLKTKNGLYLMNPFSIEGSNKTLKFMGDANFRSDEFDNNLGITYGTLFYFSNITSGQTAISVSSAGTFQGIQLQDFNIEGVNEQNEGAIDTTTGLDIDNAPSTILRNISVSRFKNGIITSDSWNSTYYSTQVSGCFIGYEFGFASNVIACYSARSTKNNIGFVIRNGGANTFVNPWVEDCSYGFVVENSVDVNAYEGLNIINPWFEDIIADAITIGQEAGGGALSTINIRDILISNGHWDSIGGQKIIFTSAVSRNILIDGFLSNGSKSQITGDLSKVIFSDGRKTSQTNLGADKTNFIYEKDNFIEGPSANIPILRISVPNREMGGVVKVKYFINTDTSNYYAAGEITLLIGRKTNENLFFKLVESEYNDGTANLTNIKADSGAGGVWFNVDFSMSSITGGTTATQTIDIQMSADNNQSKNVFAKLDTEVFSGHRKSNELISNFTVVGV